jgi:hypothetical protein
VTRAESPGVRRCPPGWPTGCSRVDVALGKSPWVVASLQSNKCIVSTCDRFSTRATRPTHGRAGARLRGRCAGVVRPGPLVPRHRAP